MMAKKRELKGIQLLAETGSIQQVAPSNFLVHSQSDLSKLYEVKWQRDRWTCNCADYAKHYKKCKHIYAVGYYLALKGISQVTRNLANERKCPNCGRDDLVIKRGPRYNRSGPVQGYYCKRCGIKFTGRTAFEGMRNRAGAVVAALDLYFRGLSLRQVAQHLEASHGIKVSHGTIYNWLKKYVELVSKHAETLTAKTSERWHADDTLLRVRGRHMVLWGLLDSETRFIIAMHVSRKRGEEDARALMRRGLEASQNRPSEVVTDGLPSYTVALKKECENQGHPVIHLQGPLNESLNNKMERFFGTVKARTKTMCKFDNDEGAKRFAKGFAFYYNFVRTHKALNGKTPAQAIGLAPDQIKWLDAIINAKKSTQDEEP